ncbi:OLC1v1005532C3 [Oldenlandia corymbosa var. corymbosa]|uniref:OLC1v1005532C3 n=1 Tax=Oldenlandia corymbosa var. corymbosa TaxID=529605 RepID=A0AAV1DH95_OLDCO|nr:OLC1v1005532C3 [Oldenlandia corymbosa var. corymbosa]
MPTPASASAAPASWTSASYQSRTVAEELIGRLSSNSVSCEAKLKALRDLKNQIIGNRTKKLSFLKLGAVPCVVSILSSATTAAVAAGGNDGLESTIIQSAAVIGSFACGFDAGVEAVLQAGALQILLSLISYPNEKVVDAVARSLKLIYQSKLGPKYDCLKSIEFLLSLLNSENENVSGLGASIIAHSCQSSMEQNALGDAGVISKLINLLGGSPIQKDSSLESLAAILKENSEVILKFVGPENGPALNVVTELTKDKHPRTRLLACSCLIVIRNALPSYLQDVRIKTKLVLVLLELLDVPGQVGDESPFVLSSLIVGKEDMQKLAFQEHAIDKLCSHLEKGSLQPKHIEGIFLALADMCSQLESCRTRLLSLKALKFVTDSMNHDCAEVRAAACICLGNVSRSVENLSAGTFANEAVINPLVQLLSDTSTSVQVASIKAISNIVLDFTLQKSTVIKCGALKQLVELSKSMDSTIRANAVCALRNLTFLVSDRCKEELLLELTQSTLLSLVSDPEPSVQEQALALIRNLVDGSIDSIEHVFAEDSVILHAVIRQMQNASKVEVLIQGMYILTNVASGNELHKEAVMNQLFPEQLGSTQSIVFKSLQSSDSRLRTVAAWALVNLTLPSSSGALKRVTRLRMAGIDSYLKNVINDPCLDVKLRARTALTQMMAFGDGSS